jgi:hypothetical protein
MNRYPNAGYIPSFQIIGNILPGTANKKFRMKKNTGEQRREIIADIVMQHVTGIETLGTAIRRLRLEVTGLDQ